MTTLALATLLDTRLLHRLLARRSGPNSSTGIQEARAMALLYQTLAGCRTASSPRAASRAQDIPRAVLATVQRRYR